MRSAEPELQNYWNWKAAGNFIGGGAGTGLLFFGALATQSNPVWLLPTAATALVLVAAGLFCVLLELGRPIRALNVIWRPHQSWMSREALAAGATFMFGAAAIWFALPSLALIAAASALVFLYCQARLLNAAKGIPAWREPATVRLVIVTGLTEGAALIVVLAAMLGSSLVWAATVLALLIIGRLLVWQLYRSRLARPGAVPLKTVQVLNELDPQLKLFGHAAPLVLLALVPLVSAGTGIAAAAVGALLALAAGWYMKFVLVTRASYNQGFAIVRSPARTPGFSRPGSRPGWG